MVRRGSTIVGIQGREDVANAVAKELRRPFVLSKIDHYNAGEGLARLSKEVEGPCILIADVDVDPVRLWEMLLTHDALQRSGTSHVTLFAPWMAYGRQDRQAKPKESVGGFVLARSLDVFRRIVTVDAHSALFQRQFNGRLKSVTAARLTVPIALKKQVTVIATPDFGGYDRAYILANHMHVPLTTCRKHRTKPGLFGVKTTCEVHDIKGERVLLVDDMVDSGGTLKEAAKQLKKQGAASVGAVVTHIADPTNKPSARSLGLAYLHVLYPRKGKAPTEWVEFLSEKLR
ncbi:ribose-phosphate diphosphokinase [Candidatus Uhrbacteria bacterium]|nr:ribose-phosphate diphosphokinase [Candidatus Uhrbacteria bacterium]MBD3284249.1 ribose-phosphate diphosphokinase [Candidatus Uhrbacteria bacterium]